MNGIQLTTIAVTVNLLIAVGMIFPMFGIEGLVDIISSSPYNLIIGILGLYTAGFYFGNKMQSIIQKWPNREMITGIIGLLIILLIGTFLGSSVGFLNEGLNIRSKEYTISDAAFDYYFKPFFWILFFGFVPAIVTGIPLGIAIKTCLHKR